MIAKRSAARRSAVRNLADLIGPVGLGAAIGWVWLMLLGGSLQFLMSASALAAASQLLFFFTFSTPALTRRAALAHRIVAS
jgi:glucose dehydrogenase